MIASCGIMNPPNDVEIRAGMRALYVAALLIALPERK